MKNNPVSPEQSPPSSAIFDTSELCGNACIQFHALPARISRVFDTSDEGLLKSL